jgi:hypothetical protein
MFREIVGQINNLRKLVTVNGKQYRYDPKSKGYKADGKTFTPSQLKAKLKGQSYTAPKIRKNLKIKDKKPTNTSPKTSVKTKVSQAANKVKKAGKSLKIKNVTNVAKNLKGTVGRGAVYGLAQTGANKLVDEGLARVFKRKGETTAEYQARVEKAKANLGKKRKLKPKTKVTNRRGRVIKKVNDLKGGKELSTSIRGKQKKTQPTTSNKDIKIKSKKTDKPSGSNTPYWESPRQKQIPEKKKRMGAIEKRNREIFGNKKIDDLKDYHKRWKAARKAGRLKEFKEKEKKKRMNR